MLALAIHVRRAVEEGQVKDFAEVARQFGVSRQRISALVRLTFLAPDIQHEVLGLATSTRDVLTERLLFDRVARLVLWGEQRAAWETLAAACGIRSPALPSRCAP